LEDAHHGFPLVEIAVVIVAAVVAGLGLMRLKQPPLVGFILAGVFLGPTGLGLIDNNENVTALAEMGVLVLLFFIGTELSLKAFVSTLKPAVIVATGQLAAGMALGGGIVWLTGASVTEGIILGFIIALSSTVVAMKMLDEMGALRRMPGRITVGVMIAQDIAVVPMLILVSSFGGEGASPLELVVKIALAVGLLAALLWWLGRTSKIKVPFDEEVGDNVELLALGSLAACFAAAAVSGLVGLSPAYGAFVAGLVIGNSTLRNRVIPVIEPIQSILLVVFFLSIGLLIDLSYIREHLEVVLTAAILVIVIKTVLNVLLLRATGFDRETALIGGLSMAQIGEFSFVLAAAGFSAGALGYDIYRLSIAVTAITLLLSPAWIALMRRLEQIAMENFTSYREALSEAYSGEIGNVEEGLWWIKVRYRAGRIARRKRREEKLARAAEKKAGKTGKTDHVQEPGDQTKTPAETPAS
jgi:CPA2 family monovalent cation:H+ antiporter-2